MTEETEIQKIGEEESSRWKQAHEAIVRELTQTHADWQKDKKLARELTSEIVAAHRDEDKAALASDEAVAHGLTSLRKDKSKELVSLIKQPYFARVITEELGRDVEFRLGTASFPDQRIIDWRKAPISKLYYDYKEGDDFEEHIQGRDRAGIIKLRRSYQGKRDNLQVVETATHTLVNQEGKWVVTQENEPASRTHRRDGHLPPILSLITPDQFALITRDPKKPMMIQGIAGSGKTTVALHRLAWLLHEDNSAARPEKCLVVMFNRSLKAYIETTLPELDIQGVAIRTYQQWVVALVDDLVGPRPHGTFKHSRDLEQFKSSSACLLLMQKYIEAYPERKISNQPSTQTGLSGWVEDLFRFFEYASAQPTFSAYGDQSRWQKISAELKNQAHLKVCHLQDDTLLLHLIYAHHGYYPAKKQGLLALCDHIVIDEAQDFGLMEIRALLNALDVDRTVTIVGDVAQKIVVGRNFDSWEEILRDAGFEDTTPLALTVSHRTTEEIMNVAASIRKDSLPEGAKALRHGPEPVFIKNAAPGMLPHEIKRWIDERISENPNSFSAVICRLPQEASDLVESLRKIGATSVRLGHRDHFSFVPGVVVTNAHQVKGLEFRNVLVVEPTEENYSSLKDDERNLLYVVATRAEVRLDFIGAKKPTSLLSGLEK